MSGDPLSSAEPVELEVGPSEEGQRLDVFLVRRFPIYSRALLRRVITAGGVLIDGRRGKPAYRLRTGQRVRVVPPEIPRQAPLPEDIPLDVLYQDEHLVVVNKPAGMVVHPARGHWSGTLASALQHHFGPKLSTAGGPTRPGIVHRLDRDTSGAILVARNEVAHARLSAQFAARTVEKEYYALVSGTPDRDRDWIDVPVGVHPQQRVKMAILPHGSAARSARTFYEVSERFRGFAALRIFPKTGRTHQIRVHLGHIGCPVLCDRQYGGRSKLRRSELSGRTEDDQVLLARQALHARRLCFTHPATEEPMEVEAPLPNDMDAVLAELRAWRALEK